MTKQIILLPTRKAKPKPLLSLLVVLAAMLGASAWLKVQPPYTHPEPSKPLAYKPTLAPWVETKTVHTEAMVLPAPPCTFMPAVTSPGVVVSSGGSGGGGGGGSCSGVNTLTLVPWTTTVTTQ